MENSTFIHLLVSVGHLKCYKFKNNNLFGVGVETWGLNGSLALAGHEWEFYFIFISFQMFFFVCWENVIFDYYLF